MCRRCLPVDETNMTAVDPTLNARKRENMRYMVR